MLLALLLANTRSNFKFQVKSSEIYCPDPRLPCYHHLYPPPEETLPPYIIHMKADREYATLVDFIVDESRLPRSYVEELIAFGAVYQQIKTKIQRINTQSSKKKIAKSTYCRVHVNPRRYVDFHRYSDLDWRGSILHQDEDLLVLSKPSGSIPSCSTVDNDQENALSKMKAMLRAKDLNVVGRLDACTSGSSHIMYSP